MLRKREKRQWRSRKGVIGIKLGMTQGVSPTTVRWSVARCCKRACVVVQRRTKDKDGYEAAQLGLVEFVKPQRVNKGHDGHLKKPAWRPMKVLQEVRIEDSKDENESRPIACWWKISKAGELVDVRGRVTRQEALPAAFISAGHYRGAMPRNGSMFHRAPGAIGGSSFPSRV